MKQGEQCGGAGFFVLLGLWDGQAMGRELFVVGDCEFEILNGCGG